MGFQLCQILVVLFALATVAWAIPVFNEPNKWDLNGNQCPLYPKRDVPCPLVCVTDLTECPSSLQPNCPPGESFCLDGSCATTCPAALPNPCLCGETAYLGAGQLLPCRTPPIIDIPSWDYLNKTALVQGACGQAIDQLGLLSYGATPTAPIWLDCPIPGNNASFNFHEPAWLALWAAMAAEAFLIAAWYMYKRAVEPRTTIPTGFDETVSLSDCDDKEKLPIAEETKSDPTACSTTSDDGPLLRFQGYRNHALGTLVIYSIVLVSIGWVVLISSITADYYGKLTGQPYSVSHENSVLSAQLFIAVWYFMTAWFLTLNITRARLRNFFRLRTDPDHSSVIQVEQPSAPLILLDHQSTILTKLHRLENQLKHMLGWHVHITTAPLQRSTHGRLFFVYQCTRYVFNPDHQEFEPFDLKMGETAAEILAQTQGLTEQEAELRTELLGTNFISVEVPSFYMAMVEEFTGFFYLYQLTILWLFYYLSYYKIGLVDTGVVIISALVKVVIRLQSEKRLKRMAEHEDTCMVLRDNKWVELSTAQLVPGDVYQVKPGQVVPCDAVVLSGNIVADESSLTGEPLPIRKFPLRNEGQMFQLGGSGKISALFAGTTISQAEPDQSNTEAASALVCRIGTATDKGQLVRKILFPNPVSFIFDEQLKLVMCILACEGLIMFGVGIWLQRQDMNMSWFNGMFCLAQIVSPILPAALVVGQSVASTRLRKMQIFCVDLPRIMVAGKTQIFCFDKTGTLTKEGLEFYGCQCVTSSPSDKPGAFEAHTMVHTQMPRLMQLALASCHAVTDLHQRLIGNPVDIEMFRSTGWDLRSPESPQYLDTIASGKDRLHVVKRFEFVHARMSMSVAILDTQTQHVHIFVKGSFEKIRTMVEASAVPADYDRVTNQLAREGCYVLAMAHRDLGPVTQEALDGWTRDDFEQKLGMLGLVLFKNNLKPDTADAIAELKGGSTRTVMITGDTALTGAFIARACGMAPPDDRMLLGDVGTDGQLVWRDVDTEEVVDLNKAILASGQSVTDPLMKAPSATSISPGLELAVTGRAFNHLVQLELIREYLLSIRVFARMTPQDKVTCVQLHMERGITAMCGDGGNDCGALRAAHVGIALSEAEASIVSPFSTSVRSIQSCVELLRQGRAALATSFAGYKYLILYGQTMVMMKVNAFYFQGTIAESLWIFIDAFITLGMTACISLSQAALKLAPQRPTARLLGPHTLASTIGVVFINWWFLIGGLIWLYQQPWFRCHEFNAKQVDIAKWWLLGDNYESGYLAFITIFQFINNGAIFNFGYLFRRSWWRNYALVAVWATVLAVMSYVLLADPNWLGCTFRLNCGNPNVLVDLGYPRPTFSIEPYNIEQAHNVFPRSARYVLWGYCLANMAAGLMWEKFVVLGPVRRYFMRRNPLKRLQLKL